MKNRILSDVISFARLIAFIVFTGGHSVAGENQLIRLDPKGKTISIVAFNPADNKIFYAETKLGS
jgi:hypothetical protein